MAYFKNKKQYESLPIPVTPPYIPPLVPSPDTPESGKILLLIDQNIQVILT